MRVSFVLEARVRACGNGLTAHTSPTSEGLDSGSTWDYQQEMTRRRLNNDLAEMSVLDVLSIPELNHLLAACASERHCPSRQHIEALGNAFARTMDQNKINSDAQHRLDALDMILETMRVLATLLREDGQRNATASRFRSTRITEYVSKKANGVSTTDIPHVGQPVTAGQPAVDALIQEKKKTKTSILMPLIVPLLTAAEAHIHAMPSSSFPRGAAASKLVVALSRMRLQAQPCGLDSDVPMRAYQRAASIMIEAEDRPCTRDWSLSLNALARVEFTGVDTTVSSRLLQKQFQMLEAERLEEWPPFDLSLLCNALHKLVQQMIGMHDRSTMFALHCFLGRLATEALPDLAQKCGPQDVAHFAASLASVPLGPNYAAARSGLCSLLRPLGETAQQLQHRHRRLVDGLSIEGLCAVLSACVRLAVFDGSSAAFVQAALPRVQRSSARFQTAHLSHLCQSLSRWLPSQRTEHEYGILSQEVMNVMRFSLCPAITACAPSFQQPKHIAFSMAALALLGNQSNSDVLTSAVDTAEALAGELLRSQLCPRSRLQWSNWPGRSLSQLSEAFSSLIRAEVENSRCANAAAVLDSLSAYLLPSEDNVTAPLLALRLADAVRLSKALCLSTSGVTLCQAATAAFLTTSPEELNVRDIAMLLSARQRLELRDADTWGRLLWQLHWVLWNAEGGALHWDMTVSATTLTALHRLGCLQILSQEVLQEESEGLHESRQALLCVCYSSMQLLRSFHKDTESDIQVSGAAPSARHTRLLLNLLSGLLQVADTVTLTRPWHMAVLEHVAFAACLHCSFFVPEAAWPTQAHKQWLAFVHLLCRLAAKPELELTPWAARLKRHISALPGPAQPLALETRSAVSALVAFASAGFDLADLGPSAPPSLLACMRIVDKLHAAHQLQGIDVAALVPALAASSSPTVFLDVCRATSTSCPDPGGRHSRGARALALTLLGQGPGVAPTEDLPSDFSGASADQRLLLLALLSLRFGLAGPNGLHALQLTSLRCLAQSSLASEGLAGNMLPPGRPQLVSEVWEATCASGKIGAGEGLGRGGSIALLIEDACLNHWP